MKILVIHNRYQIRAGEDTVFNQEVALLKSKGHQVITWTPDNRQISASNFLEKIELGINTVWSRSSYQKVFHILQDFQPNIVHVHNIIPLASPAIFYACNAQKIPVVQTIHNYRLGCPSANFFRAGKICKLCLEKSLWQSIRYGCYGNSRLQTATVALVLQLHRWLKTWQNVVDGYIALSPFVRDKLVEIGIPEAKIYLKPNFIFSNQFDGKIPQFGSYYLFIGRLVQEKGIHLLLQGYQLAQSQFPLVIIGTGELEDVVKQAAKNNPNIHYQGQQAKAQVLEWMKGAIALIFPSIWYECLPMTILEAYSHSLPVIGSKIGSIAHLVQRDRTGLLFDPSLPENLAETLQQVESNPEHWINIKQQVLSSVDLDYHPDINYQRLLNIYEQVIGIKNKTIGSIE